MFHLILALALLAPGDSMPDAETLPPVGPEGFACYTIGFRDGDKGPLEARLFCVIYDKDYKLLGEFKAGHDLPKPLDDWRVVGFPKEGPSSVVLTNLRTKQTVELRPTQRSVTKENRRKVRVH